MSIISIALRLGALVMAWEWLSANGLVWPAILLLAAMIAEDIASATS